MIYRVLSNIYANVIKFQQLVYGEGQWEVNLIKFILFLGITALMHADRDPSIGGMVIDSAMTSLKTLAEELCSQHISLPNFVLNTALSMVRNSVRINLQIR